MFSESSTVWVDNSLCALVTDPHSQLHNQCTDVMRYAGCPIDCVRYSESANETATLNPNCAACAEVYPFPTFQLKAANGTARALCTEKSSFGCTYQYHKRASLVTRNHTASAFADSPVEAVVTVYAMMLGDFDQGAFKESSFPMLSLLIFVLFMLIVAVVMFNAVIAIMSDTFSRVKEDEEASGLLERAAFILELESLLNPKRRKQADRLRMSYQTLLSLPFDYYSPDYIHVLKQRDESVIMAQCAEHKIELDKEVETRKMMQALESKAQVIHELVHDLHGAHTGDGLNVQRDSDDMLHLPRESVNFFAGVAAGIEMLAGAQSPRGPIELHVERRQAFTPRAIRDATPTPNQQMGTRSYLG